MTSITEISVKKSTAVVVLTVCIIIAGITSYYSMPRESAPDIPIPYVFISTVYPGVAPLDIEQSITIPIEKKLKGLEGVKNITSSSVEGASSIVIEFITGTDIDEVVTKTKDKVDMAKGELPSDLEDDPVVSEVNISEMPILVLSMSGTVGLVRIKDLAEDLSDEIEAVPGVLEAEITGGLEREIRVEPDPSRLAYYGLSIVELQAVIANENRNTSGGGIRMGDGRFQLRVPGEFETPDEIYGLVVGTHEGHPVYLKDVAKVVDGFKEETGRSRLNGKPAVNIQVKKRTGENILEIVDKVDEIIENQSRHWPAGTEITKLMNEAKDVRMLVEDLENNIITGLLLVIFVLFFAMGMRNAILVSMAIPFSMFLSFIVLYALGITLNMVVLFSLTLALGMLVDNAIVIVENIFRYMEQGVPKIQAAVRATQEVAMPVAASTLTTVAAFFPLLFWPGIMGGFMKYLPQTVIVTLVSSLFVALVINPVLAAIFMKLPLGSRTNGTVSAEDVEKAGEAPIEVKGPILRAYRNLLEGSLNNRTPVLLISFLIVGFLIMVWFYRVGLEKSVEFFPNIDPENVYINIEMPEGADLDYSDRVAKSIEFALCRGADYVPDPGEQPADCYNRIDETRNHTLRTGEKVTGITDIPDIHYINSRAVSVQSGMSLFEDNSPNRIGIQLYELKKRNRSSAENIEIIRDRIKNIAGGEITLAEEEEGPPTGGAINIEVSGDNPSIIGSIASQVRGYLDKMPHVYDVRDDYVAGSPTVKVYVDRQKAAMLGLSTNTIGFVLKVAYNGMKVSTFREANDDYDITIQLPEEQRKNTDILRELLIPTTQGLVPLSTIATFEVTGGLGQINRKNEQRVVTVKASVDEEVPGAVVRKAAEEYLAAIELPPGYNIKFTGEEDMQKEAEDFLTRAFAVSVFLVVIILVALFNSIMQVVIIMISVLLSLGGVFLGLTIMDYPFGIIMTGVGVISLVGVVVNNAIVLIDYTNRLCDRGMPTREAIIAAGCTRLRPVILTAVTTILGLLPMVTGVSYDFHLMEMAWVSESSQWWSSMAISVIFGLAIATILTLVVVPTLYSLVHSWTISSKRGVERLKKAYWAPFYRLTGTKPEDFPQ
ncbi:MAG: efflux RND transporter permease subunit [Deltaproteobacteria bacterium]|nr:efflux RND transporter permease subunit [Deltaproteobacteria bacterium]